MPQDALVGSTIRQYELLDKLGEGGMGVVYKARDTNLDRFVAIKLLPQDRRLDAESRVRFIREAKAASALNHPNIITVHDAGEEHGTVFIVMEFVPGKTLSDLIPRKGMALNAALRYAVQIADALSAAHAAGIVHRDLKPGNVMATDKGLVKVLDFGLAKLPQAPSPNESASTLTQHAVTASGTIVGTAAYMSPEQAEGKAVDGRSDVFSFGALLYEMVTGQRAFQRSSSASTLAAVLVQEPGPIPSDVPRDVEKVVARCLRKDPARRFQTMADLKVALEDLKDDSESGKLMAAGPPAVARLMRKALLTSSIAVMLLAILVAAVVWWLANTSGNTRPSTLTQLTRDSALTSDPAISHDGKLVAYSSDRAGDGYSHLYVQQVAGGQPLQLTRFPADDNLPNFSPDGTQIVFRSERQGGGVYVVPAFGGQERLLVARGTSPRYSPDGQWIAYSEGHFDSWEHQLYVMPAAGGTPRRIRPELKYARSPVWSPDGSRLLFRGSRADPTHGDWWITTADGKDAVEIGAGDYLRRNKLADWVPMPEAWLPDDRILFSTSGAGDSVNIWQASMTRKGWRLTGSPRQLTFGTGTESQPSISSNGVLVFSNAKTSFDVWALRMDPNRGEGGGPLEQVTWDSAAAFPSVSADGRTLAFVSKRSGNMDVWLKDLRTGTETALTSTPANEIGCRIALDGSQVFYTTQEGFEGHVARIDGGGTRKICANCWVSAITPDLKAIVSDAVDSLDKGRVRTIDIATGETGVLLESAGFFLTDGKLSPDARWIAWLRVRSATQRDIVVAPFRSGDRMRESDWITLSHSPDERQDAPCWSPDGSVLYFISDIDGFRCIWARKLDVRTKQPVGAATALRHFHRTQPSLNYVPVGALSISVSGDRMFFNLASGNGTIWMTKLPD